MLQVELKVIDGRQQGKTIPLNVRQFLIGREADCHLRPNSDLVSRHHCVITVDDFSVRLRDLGSTNGTFVNGERLQGVVMLKSGDSVSVGKLTFEVVIVEAAAVKAAAGEKPAAAAQAPAGQTREKLAPEAIETSLNISDTVEFPLPQQPADDTTIIGTFAPNDPSQTVQAAPGQTSFLPPGAYTQPVYPGQGYGMPQAYGAPAYMPGYPAGYAPAVYPGGPAYMPQPGYTMQPMMQPMPGYAMPQQQQAPQAAIPEVTLPDPSTTGAKPPEPAPPPPPPVEGQDAAAEAAKNPSDVAADIIRMHRLRRPG